MIIHIVAGGPGGELPDLRRHNGEDVVWVGVDSGVYKLLSLNIEPAYAFGDFDSISKEQFRLIKNTTKNIHIFQPEKDVTDLEIALDWALKQNPRAIKIFGATGGRIDHFLANIQLLTRPVLAGRKLPVEIIDKTNIIYAKGPGTHLIKRLQDKKYVSFIPATPVVKGLTLKGFKYPLVNGDVSFGSTLCISNELISEEGTFSFTEGILLVVRSSD